MPVRALVGLATIGLAATGVVLDPVASFGRCAAPRRRARWARGEDDLDGSGQVRIRHRPHSAQQRLVHPAAGAHQRTVRPDPRSLGFTQVDTATSGRYRTTTQVVTDPRRDAVRYRVRLRSLDGAYSPNSIAAQISGLVCAADLARRNGDDASARRWLALADEWQSKVKDWTVTSTGPLSEDRYFLRLTKDGDPDAGTTYSTGDGGPSAVDQRRVVDPSFLDLVRYGIEPPDDPDVLSTLPVVDRELRVDTPNGPFWHRFSFDGYGETRDGGQWDITEPDTFTTLGRGWPLLTGERGEYAVAAGQVGAPYLAAMARATGQGTCSPSRCGTDVRPPGSRAAPPGRAPGRPRR